MGPSPSATLWIEPTDGPPPPLAGALAAWWDRRGRSFEVLGGRGRAGVVPSPRASSELWFHLEGDADAARLDELGGARPSCFFGPGTERADLRSLLADRFPGARIVRGDPEAAVDPSADLSDPGGLPLCTWAGFGPQAPVFRTLAGRGDRMRPVPSVIREAIYLVETWKMGHLLFDDRDLAHYGDWIDRFEAGVRHLPWRITWEGNFEGRRRQGESRTG